MSLMNYLEEIPEDIIDIISKLYYISNNDIINIINSYKISYKNCIF